MIKLPNDLAQCARVVLTRAGLDPHLLPDTVTGICDYYHSPSRHYHGSGHIVSMLQKAQDMGWDNNTPLLVAVLFHDIYYEVGLKAGTNENVSARIASDVMANCKTFNQSDTQAVVNAIRHTANFMHTVDGITELDQMISDLDLSSLARLDWEEFEDQQIDIVAEQRECDPMNLIDERSQCLAASAAFLTTMLESRGGSFYYTQEAEAVWGEKAIENVQRLAAEYPLQAD